MWTSPPKRLKAEEKKMNGLIKNIYNTKGKINRYKEQKKERQ